MFKMDFMSGDYNIRLLIYCVCFFKLSEKMIRFLWIDRDIIFFILCFCRFLWLKNKNYVGIVCNLK